MSTPHASQAIVGRIFLIPGIRVRVRIVYVVHSMISSLLIITDRSLITDAMQIPCFAELEHSPIDLNSLFFSRFFNLLQKWFLKTFGSSSFTNLIIIILGRSSPSLLLPHSNLCKIIHWIIKRSSKRKT